MSDPALNLAALAAALADTQPEVAAWLAEPTTTVTAYPAPFLRRFRIDQIVYRTPYHALGLCVAWAPGEPAYPLTGEPHNFVAAALADVVNLDTAPLAAAYLTAYLETTHPTDELVYVVDSADALKPYPDPDEAEQQRLETFKAKYAAVIAPPVARRVGDDWRVTAFVVRQQTLERIVARVRPFGSIEIESENLEGGLPVVFAAR